jgi:cytochrome c oxidase subunit II
VRRKATVLVLVLGAALACAAGALAGNGGFAPVTPDSPPAQSINESYKLVALLTGLIFVLVEGALLWFVVRYRRRNRPRTQEGPQIHGATKLELFWTGVPVVILAVIVGFVLYKLPGIRDVPAAKAQGGPLVVRIDGHQFYWQFTYPNGAVSINEMHVPVNRVVQVDIHSQDVDHSWWIPALQGKFDAIPGHPNQTWFKAERIGTYRGQCGEFCGVFHAAMAASVVAQPKADYLAYISAAQDPMTLGGREWRGVCAACHGLTGKGGYGPNIQSNSTIVSPVSLRQLLLDGQNTLKPIDSYMPPVGKGWSNAQFNALITYIKAHVYKGTTSGG